MPHLHEGQDILDHLYIFCAILVVSRSFSKVDVIILHLSRECLDITFLISE